MPAVLWYGLGYSCTQFMHKRTVLQYMTAQMNTVAERFRYAVENYRPAEHMTHLAFSIDSGIPIRSVYNYMEGKRQPNSNALAKLAVIGVNVNWVLTGNGSPFERDYLDKRIVDKLLVLFLHPILDYIFSKKDGALNQAERERLVLYMMDDAELGLGGAIRALIDEGAAIGGVNDLREWVDALKDMTTPEPTEE
ncbi:MAG: hypothetical protein WD767_14400 [Alphaproteobacteria bacterium]